MQRRKPAAEEIAVASSSDAAAAPATADAAPKKVEVIGPTSRNIIPVITGLLIHSSAMILVPFAVFGAIVYDHADPLFAMTTGIPDKQTKNTIAAILAVICVNVVVASFVIRAFREEEDPPSKKKD